MQLGYLIYPWINILPVNHYPTVYPQCVTIAIDLKLGTDLKKKKKKHGHDVVWATLAIHSIIFDRRNTDTSQQLYTNNASSISSSNFSPEMPTVVIVHGWGGDQSSGINPAITEGNRTIPQAKYWICRLLFLQNKPISVVISKTFGGYMIRLFFVIFVSSTRIFFRHHEMSSLICFFFLYKNWNMVTLYNSFQYISCFSISGQKRCQHYSRGLVLAVISELRNGCGWNAFNGTLAGQVSDLSQLPDRGQLQQYAPDRVQPGSSYSGKCWQILRHEGS